MQISDFSLCILCALPLIAFGALLSVKQVAEILGISMQSTRDLIKHERLPAKKIGRDWLIESEDLETYQRERRKPGRPKQKPD